MNKILKYINYTLLLFCFLSCGQSDKYAGQYISEDACDIKISIDIIDKEYTYKISYDSTNNSGKIKIDSLTGDTYLEFKNLKSVSQDNPISALYENNSLIIQNYGNALNNYTHFKNCDLKYIRLIKDN